MTVLAGPPAGSQPPRYRGRAADGFVLAAWTCLVSAVWVESDLYRYAALALVLWGLAVYVFMEKDFRPSIGLMGIASIAWIAFIGLRYAWVVASKPITSQGASEGIYFFPLIYPTVGLVFFLYRQQVGRMLGLFVVISLAGLIATVGVTDAFSGTAARVGFLFHNNLIHASVGGGFIAVASAVLARHLGSSQQPGRPWRQVGVAACLGVLLLCLIGIFGAASRGVWFAIVLSLPLTLAGHLPGASRLAENAIRLGAALTAAAVLVVLWTPISTAVAPLIESTAGLVGQVYRHEAMGAVIEHAIAGKSLPISYEERLILWVKAVQIWSTAWVFGTGIYWRTLWDDPQSMKAPYDLMHNGYLEIGVRYGLVGLAFYATLFGWALRQSWLCMKRRLIAPRLFDFHAISLVFFLVTLLSNSNNRLALGESYMMVSAGFGFCCFYLLQWEDWHEASRLDADPTQTGAD